MRVVTDFIIVKSEILIYFVLCIFCRCVDLLAYTDLSYQGNVNVLFCALLC